MRDHIIRCVLKTSSLCSLVCIASCEPNAETILPQGRSTVTVLVMDDIAYPIYQFTCSDEEGPGSNESCPDGFECDAQHYHGAVQPIGMIAANSVADVEFGGMILTDDPDQCPHCERHWTILADFGHRKDCPQFEECDEGDLA